jgi:hypothetical protein
MFIRIIFILIWWSFGANADRGEYHREEEEE